MECGDVTSLAYKYDLKVVIPLLMVTCFETLNFIVEASTFIGCGDELKYEVNMLKLQHPLKSFLEHLPLKNYLCLKGYPYPLPHVKIMLLSGTTMKISFQMWHFWSNRLLAFQGYLIEAKTMFCLVGVLTTLW
jgi:hypothetical protein